MMRGPRLFSWMAVIAVACLVGTAARADLEFTQPVQDAGEVHTGPVLARAFAFVNRGPGRVEITDVRAGCGCLKPKLGQRVFRSEEAGELLVEVNTLSQPEGPNTWKVVVCYRDGDVAREALVQVRARLKAEIKIEPAAVNIVADGAVRVPIVLTDGRESFRPSLVIKGVTATSPQMKVLQGEIRRDKNVKITTFQLSVAEDFPEGKHEEAVVIYTDVPEYGELRVPVTVTKKPRQHVSVSPAEVRLKAALGTATPSRLFLVRSTDGRPLDIESVTCDDPAVTCRWAAGGEATATVKVSVDRARVNGPLLQTAVRVKVRGPEAQTVTVPVTCELR